MSYRCWFFGPETGLVFSRQQPFGHQLLSLAAAWSHPHSKIPFGPKHIKWQVRPGNMFILQAVGVAARPSGYRVAIFHKKPPTTCEK